MKASVDDCYQMELSDWTGVRLRNKDGSSNF